MKKLLWFAAVLLFFVQSCKQQDQSLVTEIQAAETKAKNEPPQFEELESTVASLQTALESNPAIAEADDSSPEGQLKMSITAMGNKVVALKEQYTDLQTKIQTLLANYKDGKIETEAARQELKLLVDQLDKTREAPLRYKEVLDNMQAEYAKSSAETKAETETKQPQ